MKDKRKFILTLIILLAIGFASVSTTLILDGIVGIAGNTNDFDVIFTDAVISGEGATATIDATKKSISFTTSKLIDVGEKSVLNYTVKNNSTQYDAEVSIKCENVEGDYFTFSNSLSNSTILAGENVDGVLTVTLDKILTEDITREFTCHLNASAVSRTEAYEDNGEVQSYSFGGYLLNENSEKLSNKNVVMYSSTPHYLTSDDEGYIYVEGLEKGIHEIYYMGDKSIEELKALSKDEVKKTALTTAVITTNATSVEFDNKYKIEDFHIIEKNSLTLLTVKVDEKELNRIVDGDSVSIPLEQNDSWTNIRVNNGAKLNYENNVLTVSNITSSCNVSISDSVVNQVNNIDSSKNQVILIKDETLTSSFERLNNKNLEIDFKGHVLYYPASVCKMVNDVAYYNLINVSQNSSLVLKNGGIETSDDTKCGLSDVSGNLMVENLNVNLASSGANIWVRTTSNVVIKNSNFSNKNSTGVIANLHNGSNDHPDSGGHLEVINSLLSSSSSPLINTHKGILDIENSNITSTGTGQVIRNLGKGTINIKGDKAKFDENEKYVSGTYIHSNLLGQLIYNENVDGTINVYNGTMHALYKDRTGCCTIYAKTGTINIYDGELYSYRDFVLYSSDATTKYNIYGGTFKSTQFSAICHDRGTMFISGGRFETEANVTITSYSGNLYITGGTYISKKYILRNNVFQERSGAKVYICGGEFDAGTYDISITDETSYVYYNDSVSWKNGAPTSEGIQANVINDKSLTCQIS